MNRATVLLASMLCSTILYAAEDPRIEQSRELSEALGKNLKAELVSSMATGGPEKAIDTCHIQAPHIAKQLSVSGVEVGRTALRVRNARNAPTMQQWLMLKKMAQQFPLAEGVKPPESFRILEDGSAEYLRAIPTAGVCLSCHGDGVAPSLKNKIESLYPGDQATGYILGSLRGAFVVSWPAGSPDKP